MSRVSLSNKLMPNVSLLSTVQPSIQRVKNITCRFFEWAFYCNVFTANRHWTYTNRCGCFIVSAVAYITVVGALFHIAHALSTRSYTTLHRAHEFNREKTILQLNNMGLKLDPAFVSQDFTSAIKKNDSESLVALVRKVKDVNFEVNGEPFLFWVVANQHTDVLREALVSGANPNLVNSLGYSLLLAVFLGKEDKHLSVSENYSLKLALVEILMEYGADPIFSVKGAKYYPETPLNSAFKHYYITKLQIVQESGKQEYENGKYDSILALVLTPLFEKKLSLEKIMEGLGKKEPKDQTVNIKHIENRFYYTLLAEKKNLLPHFYDIWKGCEIGTIIQYKKGQFDYLKEYSTEEN